MRLEYIHWKQPVRVISFNDGLNRKDRRAGLLAKVIYKNIPYKNKDK
mgnify:CR=1 FL=1